MNTRTSVYLLVAFLLAQALYSCQTADTIKRTNTNQIVLDEVFGYSKVIHLDPMATFEFIPLETTDESLLDGYYVVHYIGDDNIVITSYRQSKAYFFDRAGKFKSSFRFKGPGPNELRRYSSSCFWDPGKKELYLNDHPERHRILVFDEKGTHLRTLSTDEQYSIGAHIADFDEDTFLAYDEENMESQDAHVISQANPYPYILLSKTTGEKVGELPFYIPKRVSTVHRLVNPEGEREWGGSSLIYPFKKYGDEFVIGDLGMDSIYRYSAQTRKKTFLFSKLPELQNQESPKTLVWLLDYNDKYATFRRFVNRYDLKEGWVGGQEYIVYDQQKKSFSRTSFEANGMRFISCNELSNAVTPKNTICARLPIEYLFRCLDEERIKNPELKRIVSSMKFDDNDMLMLIHFR